jgi:signal transduction histidine kinase
VQGALETVRNLSLNLRPPQLDHLGLSAAIAWQAEKQAQSAGLELRLELDDPQPKPQPDVELACFRIVQEALANVSKHSVARRVEVRLRPGDGSFMLEIEDDGEGFDVKSRERLAMTGRSVGLLSMRERASLAGGQLQIDSAPGRGTRVRAEFPNAAGPAALPRSQA